jgi:hypothetical protein
LKRRIDSWGGGNGYAELHPFSTSGHLASTPRIDTASTCKKRSIPKPFYAKYGMTSNKLSTPKTGGISCIILCKGWPSWFWAARAHKLDVKLVVLSNMEWGSLIKTVSPATQVSEWKDIVVWPSVDVLSVILVLRVN